MTPKLIQNPNVRNEGNIENESCSTTWVDHKTVVEPYPKKSKMTPKLSQNQKSELKETQKMKVFQLLEYTPKQLSNPSPTPTPAH